MEYRRFVKQIYHSIVYQDQEIQFEIRFSKRKTFGIKVSGDGSVIARSPDHVGSSEIISFVEGNCAWIITQRKKLMEGRKSKVVTNPYIDGALHRFLGKEYPLKISESKRRGVSLFENFLIVKTPKPEDSKDIEKTLRSFYKIQANSSLPNRIKIAWEKFTQFNLQNPIYRFRFLKRKWGTCRMDGVITLNLELMKEDFDCIDYVIIHEMCHLMVPNHSRDFYALMDKVLPNHKLIEKKLDSIII